MIFQIIMVDYVQIYH